MSTRPAQVHNLVPGEANICLHPFQGFPPYSTWPRTQASRRVLYDIQRTRNFARPFSSPSPPRSSSSSSSRSFSSVTPGAPTNLGAPAGASKPSLRSISTVFDHGESFKSFAHLSRPTAHTLIPTKTVAVTSNLASILTSASGYRTAFAENSRIAFARKC